MNTSRLYALLVDAGWLGEAACVASDPSPHVLEKIAYRADRITLSSKWSMPVERIRDEASRLLWGDDAITELSRRRQER